MKWSYPQERKEEIKKKRRQTMLNRYGVESALQSTELQQKFKRTMVEKYGVEHALQSLDIRRSMKQHNLENWGAENVFQSEKIKNKSKESMILRHGAEYAQQSETIKGKRKQTNLERYGIDNPFEKLKNKRALYSKSFLEKVRKFRKENDVSDFVVADKFQMNPSGCSRYLRSWGFPSGTITSPEQQIIDLLKVHFPRLKTLIHDRTTLVRENQYPLEIDILIPSLKLGIEVNGSYWHQDDPKGYKYNKYLLAKEKGIDLLHLHVDQKFDEDTLMIILEIVEKSYEIP